MSEDPFAVYAPPRGEPKPITAGYGLITFAICSAIINVMTALIWLMSNEVALVVWSVTIMLTHLWRLRVMFQLTRGQLHHGRAVTHTLVDAYHAYLMMGSVYRGIAWGSFLWGVPMLLVVPAIQFWFGRRQAIALYGSAT